MHLPASEWKKILRTLTASVLFLLVIASCYPQTAAMTGKEKPRASVEAYTLTGDGVILNPDGTWRFSGKRGVYEVDTNGIRSYTEISIENLLPAIVTDVYDGDTLTVGIKDPPPGIRKQERVRLLGIDTPEMNDAGSTPPGTERFSVTARDYTRKLVLGKTVYLAFESSWRDQFSRLLCYVYLDDGLLLNTRLLTAGYASVYSEIRCAFQDEFIELEAQARKAGHGIWGNGGTGSVLISTIYNEGTREFVELINRSSAAVDISGWTVRDASGNTLTVPEKTALEPGGVFRIHSGSGGPAAGSDSIYPTTRQIWNNAGDTATLYGSDGSAVDSYRY